jgi:hypothetical protein
MKPLILTPRTRPQPGGAGSKIGPISTNRTVATVQTPAVQSGQSEYRYQANTYITKVPVTGEPPQIIYNGDRLWARVTLTLETAGPVAVGENQQLTPVLSGKGQLLQTGVATTFNIGKGNKLYVAATTVNRIKVLVEAVPWLETITGLLTSVLGSMGGSVLDLVRSRSKL